MDQSDKIKNNVYYDTGLQQYGYDIKALYSGTEERRQIRFKTLCEVGITSNCSVLDLGCGFGDYYKYLCEKGLNVQYVGYDIHPGLVDIARSRYCGAEFHVKDIQIEDFPDFDYIVSTSAFNLPLDCMDNYDFAENMLSICYQHAKKGVAIDFFTTYTDFPNPVLFAYSPERLFSISKKITKRVCLRHDYPLFDFCLYLYPDFDGWR